MSRNIFTTAILMGIVAVARSQRVDVAMVIDGSGSVYDYHPSVWNDQIDLVKQIIQNLNLGGDDARVALVSFSQEARVEWNLERYFDKTEMLRAVDDLKFTGGRSNIQDALLKTWGEVFNRSRGDRNDAGDVVIVLSDGKATVNIATTSTTAEDMQAAGILMSAIAVGPNPDRAALRYLSNMQTVYDTTSLSDQNLFQQFMSIIRQGLGQDITDPCASSPCLNGGTCSAAEDPYGWGFYCVCVMNGKVGGRLCQINSADICSTCPPEANWCHQARTSDKGRYCYFRDLPNGIFRFVD